MPHETTDRFQPNGQDPPAALAFKVENAFARLGMWWRLSGCYEQTPLGAQIWLEVACVAYLCGSLRAEPT